MVTAVPTELYAKDIPERVVGRLKAAIFLISLQEGAGGKINFCETNPTQ